VGEEARNAAKSYQESWSRSEDPLVGIFRGVAESGARAASGLFDRLNQQRGGSGGTGSGGGGTGGGNGPGNSDN
jgi:hypothetical protein